MKKLLTILLCSTFILGVATGCGKDEEKDTKEPQVKEESKGKCEVAECMKELKPEMKVDVCSKCHPYWTGSLKQNTTGGRADKFKKKYGIA